MQAFKINHSKGLQQKCYCSISKVKRSAILHAKTYFNIKQSNLLILYQQITLPKNKEKISSFMQHGLIFHTNNESKHLCAFHLQKSNIKSSHFKRKKNIRTFKMGKKKNLM